MSTRTTNPALADQRAFVRVYRMGKLTLPQVLQKTGVTEKRLARWMKFKTFLKLFRPARRRVRLISELTAELNKSVSENNRSKKVESGGVIPMIDVRMAVPIASGLKEKREPRKKPAPEPQSRAHPDISAEEAHMLLERMHWARM